VRLQGTREIDAERTDVFRALTDPRLLAESLPFVSAVRPSDADHFSAELRLPLLPRASRLRVQFEILERRDPEHARVRAEGKSLGASFRLSSIFDLGARDRRTELRYEADVALGGLLSRVPHGTLERAAQRVVDAVLRSVERRAAR
jgi:carbon monoxide dehydrogenase subunit G